MGEVKSETPPPPTHPTNKESWYRIVWRRRRRMGANIMLIDDTIFNNNAMESTMLIQKPIWASYETIREIMCFPSIKKD